jgi:hypothetical protein
MKLSRFLAQVHLRGGTEVPSELDPLPLIMTRIGINRYSVESQALLRACLAGIAIDGEMAESDIWALGGDARGLLNAFAMRRLNGKYRQVELYMLSGTLRGFQAGYD